MPISFTEVGIINGVAGQPSILNNPTSLQFGPDGRLYVSEQNGSINVLSIDYDGVDYIATAAEELVLADGSEVVKSIINHNDDGSVNTSETNRQVTGLVVTGTSDEPVLYISSSDPQIASNGEKNLDTNSGIVTKVSFNSTTGEWEAVDLIRGLPRSEENHANNGMVLSEDGETLYLTVGGNTNNGAPSGFFSYTGEYALSGTVLEIDLPALEAMETKTDPNGGQNGTSRDYKYDLPTLDDPNVANDGVREDENGMDVAGPWGGNDGLNMAILPADAPLRIYADGFRNAYDLAMSPDGKIYTVDNGSNGNLGGNPQTEGSDEDGDGILGEATNEPNNGGDGDPEPLYQVTEGTNYGHPAPVRANQNMSWTAYNDAGDPDTTLDVHTVDDISDLVPDGVQIADGFLIDPSKFAGLEGLDPNDPGDLAAINARLFESGVRVEVDSDESKKIVSVGTSTNGIVVYDSQGTAFDGVLDGKLFVTQFNDNVTLLNINADGTGLDPVLSEGADGIFGTDDDVVQQGGEDGVLEVANNFLGVALANPLDVALGPDGTLWVAEIGGNEITVLAPSGFIPPGDIDTDDDGIANTFDPFVRDASNGTDVVVQPGEVYLWDFDPDQDGNLPGPDGFGGGLTGVMINGTTDFEEFLQAPSPLDGQEINLDNVKFITAAGGGNTVIENVSNGDPFQSANSGEFLFHTGVTLAENVGTATIKWSMFNPADQITGTFQQVGGYIGTGDQSNYLKVVAIQSGAGPAIQVSLENNDGIANSATYSILQPALFDTALIESGDKIYIELEVDLINETATPVVSYDTSGGLVVVSDLAPIDLTGSNVLTAVKGDNLVQGQESGLAVGLFSTNNGESAADTFSATFDDIEITATEVQVSPNAVDDGFDTGINSTLIIPVADLLANDTDANPNDVLSVTAVSNAQNGTAVLNDNDTAGDASDDFITFIPGTDFNGVATFNYTLSDGTDVDEGFVEVLVSDAVVIYRVNAGGDLVAALDTDPVQIDWAANAGGGAQSGDGFSNNTGNISTHSIANQNDPAARDASLPSYVPYEIFNQERWDPASGAELQYNFDVVPGTTYQVNLFIRNGFGGTSEPGTRVYDIEIEGVEYFSDVDPSADYGHQVGGMLSQTIVAGDDSLDIEFLHQVENPLVNGIEIIQLATPVEPPKPEVNILTEAPTVTESDGQVLISIATNFTVPQDETVDVVFQIESNSATGDADGTGGDFQYVSSSATFSSGVWTDTKSIAGGSSDLQIPINIVNDDVEEMTEEFTFTILSVSDNAVLGTATVADVTINDDDQVLEPGDVLVRINSGGAEVAATDGGPVWQADTGANPTSFLATGGENTFGANATILVDPAAVNGAPAAIFNTERFDLPAGDEMTYDFVVQNGTYTVNLYLGEGSLDQSAPDARLFDVAVEGVVPTAFDDIQLFEQGGSGNDGAGNNAFVLSTTVDVEDGVLDLDFLHDGVNNPAIRGIEIVKAEDDPGYTPPADALFGAPVEISDDRLAPTDGGTLALGDNIVVATQEGEVDGANGVRDRDYFTFTIPEGTVLTGIFLDDYENANPTSPDGFLAIQLGGQITVDPATGAPDPDTDGLLGALVYGSGDTGANLLDIMAQGGEIGQGTGQSLPGFEPALSGQVTVWLNQGAGPSTPTLRFAVEEVPDMAPTAVTLTPIVTTIVDNADLTEDLKVADIAIEDDGKGTNALSVSGEDAGLFRVDATGLYLLAGTALDAVANPDLDVTVEVDGVDVGTVPDATAALSITVTEAPTNDIDGDGILNLADPFAFDGANGMDRSLTPGAEFVQSFDTPTEDPFDANGGFSGILVNPAFDPGNASDADPYGDRTLEDGVSISDGVLSIASSNEDSFGGGTGGSNTIRDNYQSAIDVSGTTAFEVAVSVQSPDFAAKQSTTEGFEQFGLQVGAGGVDDFIKLVVSDANAGAARVQLSHNNGLINVTGGNDRNFNIPDSVDLAAVADFDFSLTIDRSVTSFGPADTPTAGSVVGKVVFLDGDGGELYSFETPPSYLTTSGALFSALNGQNLLTGGTGGIGYGVVITDFGGADNQITATFDDLTIRSLDTLAVAITAPDPVAEDGDTGDTVLEFALSTDAGFNGQTDVSYSLDGGATVLTAEDVTFVDGAAVLPVAVPNDDVANPDTVTVTLLGFDNAALVLDETVTADGTVIDDEVPTLTLSIDPSATAEDGPPVTATLTRKDGGAGELVVQLSSDDPTEASVPAEVIFADGQTSLTFDVTPVDDDELDGAQAPTITATAAGFADGSASVQITDDEVANPLALAGDLDGDGQANAADDDIDGDGVLNLDDRTAYESNANPAPVLADGAPIVLDFAALADGTSPFEAGFTGVAQTENGTPELNYADNTATGGGVTTAPAAVSGGRLVVGTTNDDTASADSGFTFLADTNGESFELVGTFDNPAFGADPLVQFSQFGLAMSLTGAEGVTGADFIKLTTGNPGAGLELSGSANYGGAPKPPYPDGVTGTNYAQVTLTLTATVVGNGVQVSSLATYLDDDGAVLGQLSTAVLNIPAGTPMFAALTGADGAADIGFGITSTDFGAGDGFALGVESLSLTQVEPDVVDPTSPTFVEDLLADLDASDGIATGGTYDADAVGSVVLDVMSTVDNVESSNFGAGSFQLTNTGDKNVAAVFIDFREAVFGDSVIDFDGTGGDTTAKLFSVSGGSGTSAFFDPVVSQTYYLPGDLPLPNTTSSGTIATGGWDGLLLKAGTSDGGFETGETVAFAGDMDPNSIAGLEKSLVDSGAISGWDVGGVSGAEIAGSTFHVLFDDGTTAKGVLGNSGTQAGSIGRAVEGQGEATVDVTVNGGSGEYGGTEPNILVTGVPGQLIQVTLSKGFQPVINMTDNVDDLVNARLLETHPDFLVNNAFDVQTIELTIGADGTATVPPGAFDYVNTTSGVSFDGDDVAAIAVAAVAVDTDGFAIGPVDRSYLSNPTKTPVGDLPPAPPEPIALTSQKITYLGTDAADVYLVDSLEDSTNSQLDRIRSFDPAEGDMIDFAALGLEASAFSLTEKGTGQPWVFTRIDGPDGFRLRVDAELSVVQPGLVFGASTPLPPTAMNDTASTAFETAITIDVLGNDLDPNGDPFGITGFDATSLNGGVITLDDNGTADTSDDQLVYTPDSGFSGQDIFFYTVADDTGLEGSAQVTVTVASDNPPPPPPVEGIQLTSAKETFNGTSGADVYVVDAANDSNNGALDRIRAFDPSEGDLIDLTALGWTESDITLTEKGSGQSWVFTRIDGPDGFRLRIDEPLSLVENGITYAVEGPLPPIAGDDAGLTELNTSVLLDVLSNDRDPNGDALSISDFDAISANGGTISLVDGGNADPSDDQLLYTPSAEFSGPDSFSYAVTDGLGGVDTATVTITVGTPPPPPPVEGIQLTADQVTYDGTPDADVYVVDSLDDSTRSALDRIESFDPDEGDLLDLSALGLTADDFVFEEKGSGQSWEFTRITGPDNFVLRIGEDMETVMDGIVYGDTLF